METKNNKILPIDYTYNGKSLTFIKPLVMGIVNITPDSFYDGNKYNNTNDILRDIEAKIAEGADIIDIGAISSRPGASEISETDEWSRLESVIKEVRNKFPQTILSIDTFRSSIAQKSADLGADLINDISGGNMDSKMFATIAKLQIPYIIMHMQGTPQTMQTNPNYTNVNTEVHSFFQTAIQNLRSLNFHKIILDPGFGFGKNTEHNFTLLKNLNQIANFGFPVLVGISRKSMINKVINTNPVTSLNGTSVLNTIALINGAKILRVHDVKEAKQAIELVEFYKNT